MKNSLISVKDLVANVYHDYVEFVETYGSVISRYRMQ